jgi:lysozyme
MVLEEDHGMERQVRNPRIIVAALTLSAAGLVGLVSHEGYSDNAIIPVPGDVPTIGFGTTEGVKLGDTITPPKALSRALSDAQKYEGAIKQCVSVPLHQYEYDAYTSLAYNIGPGAFCGSTLVRKANAEDYPGACREILRWDRAGGRVLRGLTIRRQAEYQQCIGSEQ